MPVIELDPVVWGLGGRGVLRTGRIEGVYWAGDAPYTTVVGSDVVTPSRLRVDIVDGVQQEVLSGLPTDGNCCVRFQVTHNGVVLFGPVFVTLPDVPTIAFGDLPVVDPATFAPTDPTPTLIETIRTNTAVELEEQKGAPEGVAGLGADGVVPESQIPERLGTDALNATIAESVGAAFGAPERYTSQTWAPGAAFRPVYPRASTLCVIGSSSESAFAGILATALGPLGVTVVNRCRAGERWEHHLARTGVRPALLTFAAGIPTSGSVAVTCDLPTTEALLTFRGYVDTPDGRVLGSLSLSGSGGTFSFAREAAGTAIAATGALPFIPTATSAGGTAVNPAYADAIWALGGGKNNTNDANAAEAIIAAREAMIAWMVPMVKRFYIIGMFPNTAAASTAIHRENVAAVNAWCASAAERYGVPYWDIWDYISGPDVWTDTGLTKDSLDDTQIAAFEKPHTLSEDNQHLLPAVWTAFEAHVTRQTMYTWFPEVRPWTPLSIPGVAAFIDPKALTLGAITSFTDEAGASWAGTATVSATGIEGKTGLVFNGSSNALTHNLAALYTGAVTILALVKSSVLTTQDYFYDGYNTTGPTALRLGGRRNATNFQIVRGPAVTGAAGDNNAHKWTAVYDGTTGSLSVDEGAASTGSINAGTASPHDRLVVGARGDLADFLGGAIGPLVYVHGTVASGDLAKWYDWLDAWLA